MDKAKQFWQSMGDEVTSDKVQSLDRLVREWAEATGNMLYYEETLRGVSVNDLMKLALFVEQMTREQCAKIAESSISDRRKRRRRTALCE